MDGSDLTSPMLDAIDEPAGDVDVFDVGYELMLLAKNGLKSWATKRRRKKKHNNRYKWKLLDRKKR